MNLLNMKGKNPNTIISTMIKQNPNLREAYSQMMKIKENSGGNADNIDFTKVLNGKKFSKEDKEKFIGFATSFGAPKNEIENILRKF